MDERVRLSFEINEHVKRQHKKSITIKWTKSIEIEVYSDHNKLTFRSNSSDWPKFCLLLIFTNFKQAASTTDRPTDQPTYDRIANAR